MTDKGQTYRPLPGRLRGIFGSSSLWMASDHILLVKSSWFREEYKRFYLRDIQAVAVARCPRFPVSRPVFLFFVLWLIAGLGFTVWPPVAGVAWVLGGIALAATWLAVSAASSCRCRLYTAVSRDELPSLYRTWTAHRFLSQVKPRINQVQGTVEPGWIEAERAGVAPADTASAGPASLPPAPRAAVPGMTPAAGLFVLTLLLAAFSDFGTAHYYSAGWLRLSTFLALAQIAGAVAVFLEYRHGKLRRGMQRLAIASLVLVGVTFNVQTMALSFLGAAAAGASGLPAVSGAFATMHRVVGGLRLLGALIGVALLTRGRPEQADIIKN